MARPTLVISAPEALFESFFTPEHRRRLSQTVAWKTFASRSVNSAKKSLVSAHALITTWDSPSFGDDLLQIAPELRIIAHCGGEVKSRFGKALFDQLTITTAPEPMARAT